jgi:hypothetical protein
MTDDDRDMFAPPRQNPEVRCLDHNEWDRP